MKKIYYIISFIFILSCSTNKVVKHHGVHFLEKKNNKLVLNQTNKNDILKLLGQPSTRSNFDNDVWIYIERKISVGPIYALGRKKIISNNVLVLEINEMGMLANKKFYNKENMKNIEFTEDITDPVYRKRSFVYDFLSSMRQKINDPLGKRRKKDHSH